MSKNKKMVRSRVEHTTHAEPKKQSAFFAQYFSYHGK